MSTTKNAHPVAAKSPVAYRETAAATTHKQPHVIPVRHQSRNLTSATGRTPPSLLPTINHTAGTSPTVKEPNRRLTDVGLGHLTLLDPSKLTNLNDRNRQQTLLDGATLNSLIDAAKNHDGLVPGGPSAIKDFWHSQRPARGIGSLTGGDSGSSNDLLDHTRDAPINQLSE